MSWRRQLAKLRGWHSRERRERELEEEIRSHLEMEAEENRAAGLKPDEAQFAAKRRFGSLALSSELSREAWQFAPLESFVRDLRHGWRILVRNPGFAAVAVVTLALGIASASSVFSMFYEMLLRQPTVSDPQHLMVIPSVAADDPRRLPVYVPPPDFQDWQQRNHSFAALAGVEMLENADWDRNGEPVRITGMAVTANFFRVLGVDPALGRTFLPDEDQPGHGGEILLSHGFWQTEFQSDPQIVGKRVRLNTQEYTVIGVMPASFNLWGFPAQVWIPRVFQAADFSAAARGSRSLIVFGRLRPGVTMGSADAEMKTIAAQIAHEFPASNNNWSTEVLSLRDYRAKMMNAGPALVVLMAATALLLLVACANVAGLLLARAGARQREVAVRMALGAGQRRLLRQLLTEGVLLAALACGAGLLLAYWAIRFLQRAIGFNDYTSGIPLRLNHAVVGFALAVAAVSVVLFALTPAIQAAKTDVQDALKEASGRSGTGAGRGRLRRLLVGGEIVLSLFLLTGTCLLIGDLFGAYSAGFGFNPDGLQVVSIDLPPKAFPGSAEETAFYDKLLDRLSKLPGVTAASLSNSLPVTGSDSLKFTREKDEGLPLEKRPSAHHYIVSPGYFSTMQIALLRGRIFASADRANTPPVAVVNQKLAQKYSPGEDALGQYISVFNEPNGPPRRCEIVGIVADVKEFLGQRNDEPQLYLPLLQTPLHFANVTVRVSGSGTAAKDIARAIWSAGSSQPIVGRVLSMNALINEIGGAGAKFMGGLMGVFAAMALLLAAVGTYGVIAYSVMQRRREIGIRIALGAARRDIVRLVLRESAIVGGVAIAIGALTTLPLPGMFAAMFNGFGEFSATPVLIGAPIFVALAVLAASAVPCVRALGISPSGALHYE